MLSIIIPRTFRAMYCALFLLVSGSSLSVPSISPSVTPVSRSSAYLRGVEVSQRCAKTFIESNALSSNS